jgi:hypothetical protein
MLWAGMGHMTYGAVPGALAEVARVLLAGSP